MTPNALMMLGSRAVSRSMVSSGTCISQVSLTVRSSIRRGSPVMKLSSPVQAPGRPIWISRGVESSGAVFTLTVPETRP